MMNYETYNWEMHGFLPFILMGLVQLAVLSIPFALVAYKLAKEKGRNANLWAFIGLVPGLNVLALFFMAGAANLKVEAKLDRILTALEEGKKAEAAEERTGRTA